MQAREVLKNIRNTHEHYCLYELLKNRLIYQGKAVSENDRKKLNDLLLSEMSIVSAKTKNSLESRKLHLLFQSFFFTDIGDYKSALKTFHELNRLFEKNAALWRHPPLDYLSSLDGILDSLRTIGCYEEMDFYISKLEQLDNPAYPEYFCFIVRKSLMIYRLTVLLNAGQWDRALQLISKSDPNLYKTYTLVDDDKQNELLFCIALTYFKAKNLKKSQKHIQEIVLLGKIDHQSMIYKASRLLNMLIHYEEKDLEYLDYEIRSYKRSVKGNRKLLQTEKIIFKVIKINPDFNPSRKNTILWSPIASAIESIEQDKYEMQLGKYFDFTGWIKDKFGK
jgi:tetratricopeptide (TPR) repeat protein